MVFSPLLIAAENSLIYRKYIKPVLMSSVECLIISPTEEKQCEMLDTIRNVFAIQESKSISELKTTELIMKLWGLIYESLSWHDTQNINKTSAQAHAQLDAHAQAQLLAQPEW